MSKTKKTKRVFIGENSFKIGGKPVEKGDTVELTPSQEVAFRDSLKPLEEEASEEKVGGDGPTLEEMKKALTDAKVEIDGLQDDEIATLFGSLK